MGQQQLLLVILVVIIVGVATIVSVNILGLRADQSNRDAVRQELLTAASHVQEIWERPEQFNGAGKDFNNMSNKQILDRLRFIKGEESKQNQDNQVVNMNGTYSIISKDETEVLLRGIPNSGGDNIETYVCFDSNNNSWVMTTDSPSVTKPEGCD